MSIFEREERVLLQAEEDNPLRTTTMRRGWENGRFWYFSALESPRGLLNIFTQHIRPLFASSCNGEEQDDETLYRSLSFYWSPKTERIVDAKLKDKESYEKQLRDKFEAASPDRTEDV